MSDASYGAQTVGQKVLEPAGSRYSNLDKDVVFSRGEVDFENFGKLGDLVADL